MNARWLCASLLVLAGVLRTGAAAADEPVRPVESRPGDYPPAGTQTTVVIAGVATTAVWYGLAAGASALWPDAPGADKLRIPIAGPWMALADSGCADNDPDCGTFTVVLRAVLTTIDGVAQAGGLAVAAEGLFLPTRAPRRASSARTPRVLGAPTSFGSRGVGVSLFGSF
jgi:hypothetical protein